MPRMRSARGRNRRTRVRERHLESRQRHSGRPSAHRRNRWRITWSNCRCLPIHNGDPSPQNQGNLWNSLDAPDPFAPTGAVGSRDPPPRLPPQPCRDDPFDRRRSAYQRISAGWRAARKKMWTARIRCGIYPEKPKGWAISHPTHSSASAETNGLSITDTASCWWMGGPRAETEEGVPASRISNARENWGRRWRAHDGAGALAARCASRSIWGARGAHGRVHDPIASPASIGADRRRHCSTIHVCMKCPIAAVRPRTYVPKRGVPASYTGRQWTIPPTSTEVNAAAEQGAGRAVLRSTTQSHFASVSSRCSDRSERQAAFEKYINLNAATSPSSELGQNIRTQATTTCSRSKASLPPSFHWDGRKLRLDEPTTSSLRAP